MIIAQETQSPNHKLIRYLAGLWIIKILQFLLHKLGAFLHIFINSAFFFNAPCRTHFIHFRRRKVAHQMETVRALRTKRTTILSSLKTFRTTCLCCGFQIVFTAKRDAKLLWQNENFHFFNFSITITSMGHHIYTNSVSLSLSLTFSLSSLKKKSKPI